MSLSVYRLLYNFSPDTDLNRKKYYSFVHTLNKYKNTSAATYATEVTKQVTMSRLRSYESVTDMLLQPQQVTQEMYHNQLDVIQEQLASYMRRNEKLLQQQLGLEEMRFCDLKEPMYHDFNPSN